jgi:hypothetical protein
MTASLEDPAQAFRVALERDPELERLAQALALGSGFMLGLVTSPSWGVTRALPAVLAARASAIRGEPVEQATLALSHRVDPTESSEAVAEAAGKALARITDLASRGAALLFLCCADPPAQGDRFWPRFFNLWNQHRNGVSRALGRPLCLVLGESLESTLTRSAPDLWSVRTLTVRPKLALPTGATLGSDLCQKLETLRKTLWANRHAVLPVVGSGLSQGLPSWAGLLSGLVSELPRPERDEAFEWLGKDNYLEVASVLENHPAVGRARVMARVKELYQRPSAAEPPIYEKLVRLPVDHFITTNYDPWLKNAFSRRLGAAPRVYAPNDEGAFSDTLPGSPPLVLMVHGDADRPATCVLSSEGYAALLHGNPAWQQGMRQLIGQRRLLFVGYSASDPDVVDLLAEWQAVFAPHGDAPRHFLFDAQVASLKKSKLRRLGVEVIETGDHALLPEVLEYLASPPPGHQTPARTPTQPNLRGYLTHLVDITDHIAIAGIGGKGGEVQTALRYPIEELFTPLRTRSPERARPLLSEDASAEHALVERGDALVNLCELLPRHPLLLIEGQPGAGKTTFVRLAASLLGRDGLGLPRPDGGLWRERLGYESGAPVLTPIFLRASLIAAELVKIPAARQDDRFLLGELIHVLCSNGSYPVSGAEWTELIEGGKALLLVDGVDELTETALRARLLSMLRDTIRNAKSPIVVTSRPIDTRELIDMGFAPATIEPFGRSEIEAFVKRWVRPLHRVGEGQALAGEAERYRAELTGAITSSPQIRGLAANPVMLTCLCVVHYNQGKLPDARARLYFAIIEWLLEARNEQRKELGASKDFARHAFAKLALGMMGAGQASPTRSKKRPRKSEPGTKRASVDFGEAINTIRDELEREFPHNTPERVFELGRKWLEFECLASGIVEKIGTSQVRFWHLTFQEYLAAVELTWLVALPEEQGAPAWAVIEQHLDDPQWRETIDALPGCLFDGPGRSWVDALLRRVASQDAAEATLRTSARTAALLSRLRAPLRAYDYRIPPELEARHRDALERSQAIFTLEGANEVPVKTRIEVAEALGLSGDPRLAPDKDNFLDVPPAGIRLGKYPVTVEEYQRFMGARGYETDRYWDKEGWALKEKEDWTAPDDWETQLTAPNRPVVSVSWYEAQAYCAWLTDQLGKDVRLPTSEEWAKAATSEHGEYPWGPEEPDEERCNFAVKVGAPTPVGIYPRGDGRYGHSDLAGNVWEWCVDGPDREPGLRWVRGGSWSYDAGALRSTIQNGPRADNRLHLRGFRCVCAASSR